MMYDLRCNAGGARPIEVIFWDKAHGLEQLEHLAYVYLRLTQSKQR